MSAPAFEVRPSLPTPTNLSTERDPSARMLALVRPATDMLVRATALDEVTEIRARAAAIERYARTIRLSREAIGAAQTVARRAEVRIGELSGPRSKGGRGKALPEGNGSTRKQRHENRMLAEHWPTVEEVLGELAPEGKATRAAVLRAVKKDAIHEAFEPSRRKVDQSPIPEILEAERALRALVKGLRRMHEYGQTFSAAANARRVKELCREVEELL